MTFNGNKTSIYSENECENNQNFRKLKKPVFIL